MNFDRLTDPVTTDAWAESTVVDAFPAAWDNELFGLDVPPWRQSVVQLVAMAAQHFAGRIVVADMGCSAGVYARHFLADGIDCEYHGYDHNQAVLQAACRRWQFLPHQHVYFHLLDARHPNWPIEDGQFHVVIWDTTLRFCERLEPVVAQSARIGRGWIILARTPVEQRAWREQVRYYGMATPSTNWHFDEALLNRLALENGLHLNLNMGCDDTHILSRDPLPDGLAATIPPVRRLTRVFHQAFVRQRVEHLLAKHPGPWAVYGAGEHSRWLMTILPSAARRCIQYFLDDDAPDGYTIDAVQVIQPASMDPASLAGVLISSDTLEETLYGRAVQWTGQPDRVHRLYQDLPPGPYDKTCPIHPPPAHQSIKEVASLASWPHRTTATSNCSKSRRVIGPT